MPKSKSSSRWLKEHRDDVYVQRARTEGLRSRAAFKLEEIALSAALLKPGMLVVDLGAAPGGFSQLASRKVGRKGCVIACDILPMAPIPHVDFILGDLAHAHTLKSLEDLLGARRADLVMSDMAPNLSGIADVDQAQAIALAELAHDVARRCLCKGGAFLVKLFHGESFGPYLTSLRPDFERVSVRKPMASRARSRETYVLATGFKLV
jgi:23S rRNA (uridine2552-2'-O)-methyltransferase